MKAKKVLVSARKRRLIIVPFLALCLCMSQSCQVHRIITTTAESIQRGDTATIIQTKTIESYVGEKK